MIKNLEKLDPVCAKIPHIPLLTSAIDGRDDKDIYCFKEKQPCHAGLEMLAEQIELATGQEANPFQVDPDETTEVSKDTHFFFFFLQKSISLHPRISPPPE